MMNPLEKQLWEKIRAGDLTAFRILFDTYYTYLYSYACGMLLAKEDAEEVVLDLFIELWKRRATIQIDFSLKSYLARSIHNRCLNLLKQNKTRGNRTNALINEFVLSEIQNNENPVFDELTGRELEIEILQAIETLPAQCREIFCLSRFEQLKIKEIDAKLNLSESTVKTQLGRALDKLSSLIKRYNT